MKISRTTRVILVTGADEAFSSFLLDALSSLLESGVLKNVDLGVLDQGLSTESLAALARYQAQFVLPLWPDFVPRELRRPTQIGLVSRPLLRDLFPGYDVYIWFDADAWVQDGGFVGRYVSGALSDGAAVALENGNQYQRPLAVKRWWIGNHIASFGLRRGLMLARHRSINIGVLAISATAPHWAAWIKHYRTTIDRTGKLNLDQHAFHAAIYLDGLNAKLLHACDNWLPILSAPTWDADCLVLREPGGSSQPISIIHLAGSNKARTYTLRGKTQVTSPLLYRDVVALKARLFDIP